MRISVEPYVTPGGPPTVALRGVMLVLTEADARELLAALHQALPETSAKVKKRTAR